MPKKDKLNFSSSCFTKSIIICTAIKIRIIPNKIPDFTSNKIRNFIYKTPDFICLLNDVLTDYIVNSFKTKKITIIGYGVRKNATLNYNISYIIDPKYLQ